MQQKTDQYRQYEEFLRKVLDLSEDFQAEEHEGENGVKQIIDRYETLKQKEKDFKTERDRIEAEKDDINKEIVKVRKQLEDETLGFNSKYNDLKFKIDELNLQNRKLESEIEGKLNENNSRQAEFAQIIMAIKNLHYQIRLRQDEETHLATTQQQSQPTQPIQEELAIKNSQVIDKLNFIRDKMRYLLEIKDQWFAHCKEKGLNPHFHGH